MYVSCDSGPGGAGYWAPRRAAASCARQSLRRHGPLVGSHHLRGWWCHEADYAAGDFVAAYEESIGTAVTAFGADGALDRTIRLPFGKFPGTVLLNLARMEQFTHGWDLARAIGRPADLDPGLAGLLSQARLAITDAYRGPDSQALFGPARRAPCRGGTGRPTRRLPRPRGVIRAR
jgi:uncharacterized protein (TIGR03086 family)